MRRYRVSLIHPNVNANMTLFVRAKSRWGALCAAHDERVRRNLQGFTLGDAVAA